LGLGDKVGRKTRLWHWALLGEVVSLTYQGDVMPTTPRYCEEIRVFKAGDRLNTLAWNNKIRDG